MVRYNSKLRRQCEACREMRLGFSECLAFVYVEQVALAIALRLGAYSCEDKCV